MGRVLEFTRRSDWRALDKRKRGNEGKRWHSAAIRLASTVCRSFRSREKDGKEIARGWMLPYDERRFGDIGRPYLGFTSFTSRSATV
jgi:hypothetical protein